MPGSTTLVRRYQTVVINNGLYLLMNHDELMFKLEYRSLEVDQMDLRRAARNLRLVLGEEERPDDAGDVDQSSLADRDLVETQVPEAVGFSSSPIIDSNDGVFVSTQVQGRLDDVLREEALQDELKRFKYNNEGDSGAITKRSVPKRRKPSKKSQQRSLEDFSQSKSGQLLKRLSGKHGKVRDVVESQRKRRKVGVRAASQYDTYNAEEWHYIHRKLLEHFPQNEPDDVKEVFCYLYGPDQSCNEKDLWGASQLPPNVDTQNSDASLRRMNVPVGQEVRVLTLSQVLSDTGNTEPEAPEIEDLDPAEDDDASTIPDSTDDTSICIPIGDADRASTQFYTPRMSLAEQIIDPTQESFKVVKSLISPLKHEETPLVQVPATRTSTILTHLKLSANGNDLNSCLKMVVPKSQLTLLKEKLSSDFEISLEEQPIMSDTESTEALPVYLQRKAQRISSEVTNPGSARFASQSAQKLRQSIKAIGLKPCRSKSQMIASLEAASQVLDSSATEQEQRHLIYDNLTKLVYSCPSLLERVYTFQPIPIDEMLLRLTEANPFIDHVDEPTIRTWADRQGICLTSSN